MPPDDDISKKVKYVKSQGQYRDHICHWPGCTEEVPPAMWGCTMHWYMLPQYLRLRIWAAYRIGQERTKDISPEYLEVARMTQRWIKENYPDANNRPTEG
jgi:hypothetical protein